MTSKIQAALELRKTLQIFLSTLSADERARDMMAVASVFPVYRTGKEYKAGEVFSCGENAVGDPQLYQVLQDHSSAAQWPPGMAASLYKAIGVTEEGYPEWVQPLGDPDAYGMGEIVSCGGVLYRSLIDGNVWPPDAYPAGWERYTA